MIIITYYYIKVKDFGLIAYGTWWFIDLFTTPNQVDKYNEDIEIETIKSFKKE